MLCGINASAQFVGGVGELNRYRAQRRVADYLHDHFYANSGTKIFCDEGTVRALSGIPEDRFVTSTGVPRSHEGFSSTVEWNKIEWLIVSHQPGSIPDELFQGLNGKPIGQFEAVFSSHTKFLSTEIWVYSRKAAP
jgi:hypothetical protein